MRLAGMDDGFELGVRQKSAGDDIRRQMRAIARRGGRDRRHRRRLHELGRMLQRAGNTDRLKRVFLIKRIGDFTAFRRRPCDRLVSKFDARRLDRG